MEKVGSTITITLKRTRSSTASSMPELGHVGYQLTKLLPELVYKDASGKLRPLGDHYIIDSITTGIEAWA